jgi:hypothetical protein
VFLNINLLPFRRQYRFFAAYRLHHRLRRLRSNAIAPKAVEKFSGALNISVSSAQQ